MNRLVQRYRYSAILLRELVKTDFKLRYQGSVLGYLWSLLRPLALFLILYLVFAKFLKFGGTIPHYPVYLLLGIMLWNYFVEVTSGGVGAIVAKGDLLRKLNFPKYIIIIAGSIGALINLVINFVVLGVFMLLSGANVSPAIVYVLPLVLLQLFLLSIGLSFLLSALYVKFRDVNYIWEVILQAAFYATPILYPISLIPHAAAKILMMNPVAQIIQDARYVLITPQSETVSSLFSSSLWHALPVVLTLVVVVISALYFRSRSKHFAEEV
jgi:ABC-2 type transport system permease protein